MSDLLEDLTSLAADPHPDRRRDLLRAVSDLFLENATQCTDRETALVDDVMTRVLDQVEIAARVELAEKLAHVGVAPHGTVFKLASDEAAEVAAPVLQHSTVLSDADLARIAETRTDAHMVAIARRHSISERLTDVLVRRGSKLVLHTVTENEGARFSQTGFAELARRARDDRGLQMRLAAREDVPDEILDEVLPLLAEELSSRLGTHGDIGQGLEAELAHRLRQRLGVMMAARVTEERQVANMINQIRGNQRDLAATVVELADRDRQTDVAEVLSAFAGISMETALGALSGGKRETLVILLRSLDLPRSVFEAILRLEARRKRIPYVADPATLSRFESVSAMTAQRAIRFHKVRATAMAS